jgi:hypothetical protein
MLVDVWLLLCEVLLAKHQEQCKGEEREGIQVDDPQSLLCAR